MIETMKTSFPYILLLLLTVFSASPSSGQYTPVDISNLPAENRSDLAKVARRVKMWPTVLQDALICEQLSLAFSMDGGNALTNWHGISVPSIVQGAFFVDRSGKPRCLIQLKKTVDWEKIHFEDLNLFPSQAILHYFKKEVKRVTLATAKYHLSSLPDTERQAMLALLAGVIYHPSGEAAFQNYSEEVKMNNGVIVVVKGDYKNSFYTDADGNEHKLNLDPDQNSSTWRRRMQIWRCANIVGNNAVLGLVPNEVKALRRRSQNHLDNIATQRNTVEENKLVVADEMMRQFTPEQQYARIATAAGLYFKTPRQAGLNGTYRHLDPDVKIILPDGQITNSWEKCPPDSSQWQQKRIELLEQISLEGLIRHYEEPIKKMARQLAKNRFTDMPDLLREALQSELKGTLTTKDGTPATDGQTTVQVEACSRYFSIPHDNVRAEKAYFPSSNGKIFPYSIVSSYENTHERSIKLIYLCAYILGKKDLLQCISESDETKQKP